MTIFDLNQGPNNILFKKVAFYCVSFYEKYISNIRKIQTFTINERMIFKNQYFHHHLTIKGLLFLSSDMGSFKLILILFGKCAITIATTVTYVYTAELFPTPLRQTLVGICSMFGRFGSMIAPQMPLLVNITYNKFLKLLQISFF